jgi:hypothetical protein
MGKRGRHRRFLKVIMDWRILLGRLITRMVLKRLIPVLILLAAIFWAWRIYTIMIVPAGPFLWDEAAHALRGLLIADDIRQGSWLGFLLDTYRQVYWPPLHSWFTGLFFLITGPDVIAARTCSLFFYLLTIPPLYLAAKSMREKKSEIAGLVAVVLWLTSPLLMGFASQCMLEIPGLFAVTLTLFIYFKVCREERRPEKYIFLGLGIALTYFVKSNYGILLFLAIAVMMLMESRLRPKALLNRINFFTLLPLVIIFSCWFAYPKKIIVTWEAMVNMPVGGLSPYNMEGLLFYPRALVSLAGSIWICVLFLLSMLASFRFWKDKRIRFLLVLVLLQIILGELHHDKMERHILPILPCLFLLTGNAVAEIWIRLRENRSKVRWCLACMAGGLIFYHAAAIAVGAMRPCPYDLGREAAESIVSTVRDTTPTLVLGMGDTFDPSPPLLDWMLVREGLMPIRQAGSLGYIEEERKLAANLGQSKAPEWFTGPILSILRQSDHSGASRTLYHGLPRDASYSRGADELRPFLQQTLAHTPCRRILVVASLADTTSYPMAQIALALEQMGMHPQSTRFFHETDVRVETYRIP